MFAPALDTFSATIKSADWGRDEQRADSIYDEDAHRNSLTGRSAPPVEGGIQGRSIA